LIFPGITAHFSGDKTKQPLKETGVPFYSESVTGNGRKSDLTPLLMRILFSMGGIVPDKSQDPKPFNG
jgi:hypothetical protein